MPMKSLIAVLPLVLVASTGIAAPRPVHWTRFSIPTTGTSVEVPDSIFADREKMPDGYGYGGRFKTIDGRADLTVQSLPREDETPAAFLAKKHPPTDIQYERVTSRFFAVSSYKGDKVWYDRCNFSDHFIHCVMIDYPAREQHDWDDIVTRISRSLDGE